MEEKYFSHSFYSVVMKPSDTGFLPSVMRPWENAKIALLPI